MGDLIPRMFLEVMVTLYDGATEPRVPMVPMGAGPPAARGVLGITVAASEASTSEEDEAPASEAVSGEASGSEYDPAEDSDGPRKRKVQLRARAFLARSKQRVQRRRVQSEGIASRAVGGQFTPLKDSPTAHKIFKQRMRNAFDDNPSIDPAVRAPLMLYYQNSMQAMTVRMRSLTGASRAWLFMHPDFAKDVVQAARKGVDVPAHVAPSDPCYVEGAAMAIRALTVAYLARIGSTTQTEGSE